MSAHIDGIIKRMGYAESSCMIYGHDGFRSTALSAHYKKVLGEISPYAVYIVDNVPFVLFYEEITDAEEQKRRNRKIWNAQIPITIVCGTGDVKVYSSCSIDREKSIFDELVSTPVEKVDEDSPFSFWEITNQNFWARFANQFSGEKLNDHLLRNLSDITRKLRKDYKVDFATKLMLRLIFIRYLIDRGVDLDYKGFKSDVTSSKDSLLKLLLNKDELYKLFSHLKVKFNGNLFEMDDEINTSCLTPKVLKILSDFLSANMDTETEQLSLFDLYDFNIIPVELISNIYEILLGKEARNRDNAFYTPHYLVDYILDVTVQSFIRDNGVCKVLDPSCGSGIFLVESYRRMVEKELNGEPFSTDDTILQHILSENIYGIDLNEDAVDVAIFSLYVAALDYKNPKTLKKFTLPNLKDKNLLVANFFDDSALQAFTKISFDFIVGNPPWGRENGLHVDWCKRRGYAQYLQNKDTCRSFVLRSKDFCKTSNTTCCFVLHSKMLYMQKEPSKRFRAFLLRNTKISRIVELSSVRKLVFKNADAPAVIFAYSFSNDETLKNRFEYISMKPNLFFRLFNIIVVEKNDIKYVPQKLLLDNDWAWKTLVYGLTGDIDTILNLKTSDYKTLNETIELQTPHIFTGDGVQYHSGDEKDATHLLALNLPLLNSNTAIDHFILYEKNTLPFEKQKIHRPRKEILFRAPYCLVLRGLDMKDYTMRAVYSETDFIYRHAIHAIKGTMTQKKLLLNITGLLNSKLYAYFNIMMGSSVGIEREQRQTDEVFTFPFVFKDEIAEQVEIVQQLSKREDFSVEHDPTETIEKLNKMILKAFGLIDNVFVDYALKIQIPQLTRVKDNKAFCAVSNQELQIYANPFLEALSTIFGVSDKYVSVNIYPMVSKYYSAVEMVLHNTKPINEIQIMDDATSFQIALTKFSAHKINDMFFELKDIIHFKDNSFYIIKPNYYKNWHPAIAQLDLAEVIDQILSKDGGNE